MSFNKSPLAFDDAREVFERATTAPKGIRILCSDRAAAVVLRSRFNYFRKLDREENKKTYPPDHPMYNRSAYDKLVLRIPQDEPALYIEPHTAEIYNIEELE